MIKMNLLDVLKVLNEGENYLIKIDNYNNIGCEIRDNFNLFQRNEIPVPTPFELVGNDNRINLSVNNKVYGQVKINPIQAKKVGLPSIINGPMIYNRKTIIKDGELNIKTMDLIVDIKTYMTLKNNNIKFEEFANTTSYPGNIIKLDLTTLSIKNVKTNFTMDEIIKNVENINSLKAKQKVLNTLLANLPKDNIQQFAGFTPEQTELLKEHGLDSNLTYIGVDNEIIEKEQYISEVLEFKLKGSSMSAFSEVLNRVNNNKPLNKLDTIQYEYYNELNYLMEQIQIINDEDKKQYLQDQLKNIKGQLFNLRLRNVMIKLELFNSPIREMALENDSAYVYNGLKIQFINKTFVK